MNWFESKRWIKLFEMNKNKEMKQKGRKYKKKMDQKKKK